MHKDATAIIIIATILLILGILVSYSVEGVGKNLQNYLTKQIIILILGFASFLFFLFYDYHKVLNFNFILAFSIFCILFLLLVLFNEEEKFGAKRWISIYEKFTFQPSEITKFVVLLCVTYYMSEYYEKLKNFFFGIILPLSISGIFAGLIFLENDQGIPMIIMTAVLCMMFVAGMKWKHITIGASVLGILFTIAILMKPHRIFRIIYTWFPEWDTSGKGWQIIQSLVCFYRGGLLGVGVGAGEQKLGYLPASHRDFPFSLIGEEMGFLGTLLVVFLFFLFVYYGFQIARRAPDLEGSLLAVGITCMIGVQAIVMMMVNIGLLPVKGMCLPLISSGGTSFIGSMMMMGCLVNIGIQEERKEPVISKETPLYISVTNLLS